MNYHSNQKYLKDFHNSRVERPGYEFMWVGIVLVVLTALSILM